MTTYPQKITFGQLRASGVRDVLVYCRDHSAAITSRLAATVGAMTCGCPTSSRALSAQPGASAARMCGQCFHPRAWASDGVVRAVLRTHHLAARAQAQDAINEAHPI